MPDSGVDGPCRFDHARHITVAFGALAHQRKVAADLAFPVISPVTHERMNQPRGIQRSIVGDEQQHRLVQPLQIVATRAGEALPVFGEGLGGVARRWRRSPLTAGGLFRGRRSRRQLSQNGWRGTASSRVPPPLPNGSARWERSVPAGMPSR